VLTVDHDWDTTPDATSVYQVCYDHTDFLSLQPSYFSYVGNSTDRTLSVSSSVNELRINGYVGLYKCSLRFNAYRACPTSTVASSLFQMGYLAGDGAGVDGGELTTRINSTGGYEDVLFKGIFRFYGSVFCCFVESLTATTNFFRINSVYIQGSANIGTTEAIDSIIDRFLLDTNEGSFSSRTKYTGGQFVTVTGDENEVTDMQIFSSAITIGKE
jgi:hypothetical protein